MSTRTLGRLFRFADANSFRLVESFRPVTAPPRSAMPIRSAMPNRSIRHASADQASQAASNTAGNTAGPTPKEGRQPRRISRRRAATSIAAAATSVQAAAGGWGILDGGVPRVWAGVPESNTGGSDTLGVCVAGLNGRGGGHLQGYHDDPRTRIAAIVDIDPEVAERRAEQINTMQGSRPKIYRDLREALTDKSVDIVSIATPNHWHTLLGIWAMQAGKHVYVEKPISHNVSEGRALVETARATGRVFQTGTQCRSSQAIDEAVRAIADGAIGSCNFARGLCYKRRKSIGPLGDYAIPKQVDFDSWSGPAPLTDPKLTRPNFHYDWHWQRHYGNGDLGNQGPHQTDVARWGLGIDRHPSSIVSYGGRLGYDIEKSQPGYVDAGDTANTEVSIYDYGDQQIVFETRGLDVTESCGPEIDAFFSGGKPQRGNKIGVIFYGEDGYIVQTEYYEAKQFDRDRNPVRTWTCEGVGDAHFGNFIDAVVAADPGAVAADAMCGHLSAAISHLGNISYYLGEANKVAAEDIADRLGGLSVHQPGRRPCRDAATDYRAFAEQWCRFGANAVVARPGSSVRSRNRAFCEQCGRRRAADPPVSCGL